MKKVSHIIIVIILLGLGYWQCRKQAPSKKNETAIEKVGFYKLVFDSTNIDSFLMKHKGLATYRNQYFDFYKKKQYKFSWLDTNGLSQQAHKFYKLQNDVANNLSDSSLFDTLFQKRYQLLGSIPTASKLPMDSVALETELLFTGQFFKYASKVYEGSDIDTKELGWYIPRKKINVIATLDSIVKPTSKPLEVFEPLNEQYRLIEQYITRYHKIKEEISEDTIPVKGRIFRRGRHSKYVPLIKEKLYAYGDLKKLNNSRYFDTALQSAVKQFQYRMGLKSNGIVGDATVKELNKPIDSLIEKLVINLERSRWMLPEKEKETRIEVNIPEYKMHVYEDGKQNFSMNVVVGTAVNNTVIFNGNLKHIVFSPYWNVTDDIVKKEVMPAMLKDSDYLAKNNMEIVKYNGKVPVIRQKPGPTNSLGGVKFLFPNDYNIYFHDTPFKGAFTSFKRSFSHGCIRLGEPEKLAQFLLRKDSTIYTQDSIKALMAQPDEVWVTSKPAVPVTIKYFTAWVDEKGLINFREDIYGHDRKMAEKLFSKKNKAQENALVVH